MEFHFHFQLAQEADPSSVKKRTGHEPESESDYGIEFQRVLANIFHIRPVSGYNNVWQTQAHEYL